MTEKRLKLESFYKNIHRSSLTSLATNANKIEPLPIEGELRWGASIVLRGKLPESVKKVIEDLESILGSSHTYYDSVSWHLTIRSLEPYREKLEESDQVLNTYKNVVNNHRDLGRFDVNFKGLAATPSGILLCGYPNFDLWKLRQSIFEELSSHDLVSNSPEPLIDSLRDTCHVSLVVYGSKIENGFEVVDYLENNISENFGLVSNLKLEVVRYFKSVNQVEVVGLS